MQIHHAARILLLLHRPSRGGLSDFLEQQNTLTIHVDKICGIARTLEDDASGVMSSQCLFIGVNLPPTLGRLLADICHSWNEHF